MRLNLKSETAAAIVAGASFVASAGHIVTVVSESNPWFMALAYPIGIDGLIFVGIRAIQTGRKFAGLFALLVGGFFSLAFNAHAEHALVMPAWMIAASMPVCMLTAFAIEATAKKEEEIEAPAIPTETEWDRMQERVEARYRLEHAQAMAEIRAQAQDLAAKYAEPKPAPEPVKVPSTTDAPKPVRPERPAIEGRTTRQAAWDVEKAVRLLMDGRTDSDVLLLVDGLTAKPLQRTKRAVRLLTEDASRTDEWVAEKAGQSATHIGRVRAAMITAKENS